MKRLIIAPHVDDDVIGCGGQLDEDTETVYLAIDEFHVVPGVERVLEAMRVAQDAGMRRIWIPRSHAIKDGATNGRLIAQAYDYGIYHDVNSFDADLAGLIYKLEDLISKIQPDEVLAPWPSYNQDHRTTLDALMVATRPHDRNHFVKRVLLYEEPDCWWPGVRPTFTPNLFRSIDINGKIRRYELMKSQVRGMRSPEHLRALATIRGAAIGVPAAEAFHILRWAEV